MEATARARFQRGSARKMGQILTLLRNKPVPQAIGILEFLPKSSKQLVVKTLKSAVANAMVKVGKAKITEKDLYVKYAFADGGPLMKRFQAGPRGSATGILRRTCHINITVATKENV